MSFSIQEQQGIVGVTEAESIPSEPAPTKNEDGVAEAGQGILCRQCGVALVTKIPLRYCPRCRTRLPNAPPGPEEEPVEVIEEKINRADFAQYRWACWSGLGWWLGFAVGGAMGLIRENELRRTIGPSTSTLAMLVLHAWWFLLGGLAGSAVGVCTRSLLRPVWLAVVSSKRFRQEYEWQVKEEPASWDAAPPKVTNRADQP